MLVEELMILANEAVAGLLAGRRREALYRVHERPDPQAIALLLAKLADLEVPTPPAPDPETLTAGQAAKLAGADQRAGQRVRRDDPVAGARRFPPSSSARSSKPATTRRTSATRVSRARRTATSPRRSAAIPTSSSTARSCGSSARATSRCRRSSTRLAEHTSAKEREIADVEHRADDICLAWLLEAVLYDRGWDATFDGEITGVIGSGLFARFGDVFEGYLPVRKLPGLLRAQRRRDGAPVARRGGRRYRLGDPIEVRVADIDRPAGKIELAPP